MVTANERQWREHLMENAIYDMNDAPDGWCLLMLQLAHWVNVLNLTALSVRELGTASSRIQYALYPLWCIASKITGRVLVTEDEFRIQLETLAEDDSLEKTGIQEGIRLLLNDTLNRPVVADALKLAVPIERFGVETTQKMDAAAKAAAELSRIYHAYRADHRPDQFVSLEEHAKKFVDALKDLKNVKDIHHFGQFRSMIANVFPDRCNCWDDAVTGLFLKMHGDVTPAAFAAECLGTPRPDCCGENELRRILRRTCGFAESNELNMDGFLQGLNQRCRAIQPQFGLDTLMNLCVTAISGYLKDIGVPYVEAGQVVYCKDSYNAVTFKVRKPETKKLLTRTFAIPFTTETKPDCLGDPQTKFCITGEIRPMWLGWTPEMKAKDFLFGTEWIPKEP